MKRYPSTTRSLFLVLAPIAALAFSFGIDREMIVISVIAQIIAISCWWLFIIVAILFYAAAGRACVGPSLWFAVVPPIAIALVFALATGAAHRSVIENTATGVVALFCYFTLFRSDVFGEIEQFASDSAIELIAEFGFRTTGPLTHFDFLPMHVAVLGALLMLGSMPSLGQ